MFVLVAYDVSTRDPEGKSRLRAVAKICLNHGQRVQNSLFECKLTAAQFVELRQKLVVATDLLQDSLRFYRLGKSIDVEHLGTKATPDVDGPLII